MPASGRHRSLELSARECQSYAALGAITAGAVAFSYNVTPLADFPAGFCVCERLRAGLGWVSARSGLVGLTCHGRRDVFLILAYAKRSRHAQTKPSSLD